MNEIHHWIKPFQIDSFEFAGAFVVACAEENVLLLSRKGTTIALSEELVTCLRNRQCPSTLPLKLVQRGFAKIGNVNHAFFQFEPIPRYFIIDLTGQCNYACIYCFRDDERIPCKINSERLHNILDYIFRYCIENQVRRIGIQAWGGEPLLALDRILEMADYFKYSPICANIEVETNASIITSEMAYKLRQAGVRIGVSLDGPEWIQTRQRLAKLGNVNSFAKTIQGIQCIRSVYGNDFGIICVVTRYSIASAKELVSFFRDELHALYVKFNLVRDNPFARSKSLVPSLEQIQLFYEELWACFLDGWQRNTPFFEGTILTRMENLLRASKKNCCESSGCTGGRSIVSFDQEGNIFPCEMTDYIEEKIGNIQSDMSLSDSICASKQLSLFHKVRKIEECDACPWQPFCRGGCTSRVQYAGGSGIDEVACRINRTLYPKIAKFIISHPVLAEKMTSSAI